MAGKKKSLKVNWVIVCPAPAPLFFPLLAPSLMTSLRQLPGSNPEEKKAFCPDYGGFVSGIKKDLSVCNVFRIYLWALGVKGFANIYK